MNINHLRNAVFFCMVFALVSCTNYTRPISKKDIPTANDGYLYGRFSMDVPKFTHQTMGLSIHCADGQSYVLRFTRKQPLQVVKIAPSTCSLDQIVYTAEDGIVSSTCSLEQIVYTAEDGFVSLRKPAPTGWMQNVKLEAGKMYYLGDFIATGWKERSTIYWKITDIRANFINTTKAVKENFPNLLEVPAEDRMVGKAELN